MMETSILISLAGGLFSVVGIILTGMWHISIAAKNYGRLDQRVESIQRELGEHKSYPPYRGHAANGESPRRDAP